MTARIEGPMHIESGTVYQTRPKRRGRVEEVELLDPDFEKGRAVFVNLNDGRVFTANLWEIADRGKIGGSKILHANPPADSEIAAIQSACGEVNSQTESPIRLADGERCFLVFNDPRGNERFRVTARFSKMRSNNRTVVFVRGEGEDQVSFPIPAQRLGRELNEPGKFGVIPLDREKKGH